MAVTGRYCLKQINRAEGRDLRLDVSKLYRISSVGPWSMSFDMRETARRNFLLSRMVSRDFFLRNTLIVTSPSSYSIAWQN